MIALMPKPMQEPLKENEVFIKKFIGEYYGPEYIFKRVGAAHCTNKRIVFAFNNGETVGIMDYGDIASIKRTFPLNIYRLNCFFQVNVAMKDGRKIKLRMFNRRGFMKAVQGYINK